MRVLFRCDGNDAVGLGHLSRSIAFAEAVEDRGGEALFHGHYDARAHGLFGERTGISSARALPATSDDAYETAALAASVGADAVVVDGYLFDAAFVEVLAEGRTKRPLVIVDDFAALEVYPTGARILNFTLAAPGRSYRGRDLRILRGPRYMLVRRATRALRRRRRTLDLNGGSLLVAIGGRDLHGATLRIVDALAGLKRVMDVDVILREDALDRGQVREALGRLPGRTRLFGLIPHLADRFSEVDACVAGGGLTKYEACYLGIPCAVCSQSEGEAEDTTLAQSRGLVDDLRDAFRAGTLTGTLSQFLEPARRAALHDACYALFPEDPTRDAVEALLADGETS